MKECDILGGQDILWPLLHIFWGQDPQTPYDLDIHPWIHVSQTVFSCFAALRQIRSIRRSVSQPVLLSVSLCISLSLVGAVALRLQQHQPHRTLDAYRFVCSLYLMRQQDWCATAANTTIFHVYCVLGTGCWSQTARRTAFRLAVLVFVCRNITASEYLARDLQWTVDDDSGSVYNLRRVTNWLSGAPD